jgi:hypothetical protein
MSCYRMNDADDNRNQPTTLLTRSSTNSCSTTNHTILEDLARALLQLEQLNITKPETPLVEVVRFNRFGWIFPHDSAFDKLAEF